tara:strand:- start:253 stop:729 length:477 start_codon:yes stop_codon:yes gene_type:complete
MNYIKNNLLLFIALIFVFASFIVSLNIIFQPFKSSDYLYVAGKTLYIKLDEPTEISKDSGNNERLISINTEIINSASTELLISINEQSVGLLSVNGFTYSPLNPNNINIDINKPLWGSFKLSKNQMIKGNLIFKVKDSFEPKTFEWLESDRVIINFSQ